MAFVISFFHVSDIAFILIPSQQEGTNKKKRRRTVQEVKARKNPGQLWKPRFLDMIPGIPLDILTLTDLIQVKTISLRLPKAVPSPTFFVRELLCISEDSQNFERSITRYGEGAGISHSRHQPCLESMHVVPMQRDMLDP